MRELTKNPNCVNENDLAREISIEEGGLVNLPIGQVKEVQKILLEKLGGYTDWQILTLINKHRTEKERTSLEPISLAVSSAIPGTYHAAFLSQEK